MFGLEDEGTSRRGFFKRLGAAGVTTGLFGMGLAPHFLMQEALGVTPDAATKKFDSVIHIFYEGGPSQTDTWDPKPGSLNNVFTTINLGAADIYGKPIHVAQHFSELSTLVLSDPAVKLGLIRSMSHGNGDHVTAQKWTHCFWQSPVANLYPSADVVFAHYLKDQGLKIPSVLIRNGMGGLGINDPKGGDCPTSFEAASSATASALLKLPAGTDAARYARRAALTDAFNATYIGTRPDLAPKQWRDAVKQAKDVTTTGAAAAAFDLTGKPLLTGGPTARAATLQNLTLAQELVKAGIPYVTVGITGNDTHANNRAGVTSIWGDTTDKALAQMCRNIKTSGKRVLIVMGGEFGRTPATVAPDAGGVRRDGRDHWASGFSWALLSINQPGFKTTAVGDTGPDGMFRLGATTPLVDPIYPGVLGALIYRSMGFKVGVDAATNVPTVIGSRCPVDQVMATSTARGDATWLMKQFGLA